MADAQERRIIGMPLDLPDAIAAVAAILFENARLSLAESQRKLFAQFLRRRIRITLDVKSNFTNTASKRT